VFNLVLGCIISKLVIRGIISNKMVLHNNAHADDVEVICRNLKALEKNITGII